MRKIVLFLSLCALVALFSACVITPKDVKDTAPEATPGAAVVEEKAAAEEVAEPAEPVEEAVTEEKSAPAEEAEVEEPEEVSESAEEVDEAGLVDEAEPAAESASLPAVCLDFPENVTLLNEPFGIVGEYGEGAGQAILTGTLKTEAGNYYDVPYEYVIFAVTDSSSDFYKYFKNMAGEGNTVNGADGEMLKFTLGVLEDGKLSTTALVSQSAQDKILGALDAGEEVSLKLGVPKYEGKGAPYNFSFACVIE